MKILRILSIAALAVLVAFAISACHKKAETESSQSGEGFGTNTETPAADQSAQATPPAETGAGTSAPAAEHPATSGTKSSTAKTGTTKSTGTKGGAMAGGPTSSGTYASQQKTAEVPVGTVFEVEMVTPVDTRTSNVGDKVEAKLAAPISHDGVVVAEQGAAVRGEISDLKRASHAKSGQDRASVTFTFTSLQTVDGEKPLHATVTNSEGKLVAKSTSTRDKLIIGGSTVAGAIVGKIAGKDTKSAIIGAVGGAVVGTGAVLAAKGFEVEVPAGSKVTLRVDQPVTIVAK
jgi:hypothetical protein